VGESIVSFAVVDAGEPGLSVLFTWVASRSNRGGGVYAATMDDGALKALLPDRATLAVTRRDARTLTVTWTPPASASDFGTASRRVEALHGELVPVE